MQVVVVGMVTAVRGRNGSKEIVNDSGISSSI